MMEKWRNFKFKATVAIVAAVVLFLLGGLFAWKLTSGHYKKHPNTEIKEVVTKENVYIEKDVILTAETIESGIREVGKLSCAEYYFTHVETYDSTKTFLDWPIIGTNSSFIFSYDGVISAGLNFDEIEIAKDDDKKVITVKMPKTYITASEIDEDSCKIYEEKNNIFNPIKVENVTDSFRDMIKDEEAKAINKGLLDKAEKNAKTMIESFIKSGYNVNEYKIKFESK